MKALVYHGPGSKAWEEVPDPTIQAPTDAIVQIDTTTICGTDLHILKGDVPAVTDGRILGHEGVGTITEIGSAVKGLQVGHRVIISCTAPVGRVPTATSSCPCTAWVEASWSDGGLPGAKVSTPTTSAPSGWASLRPG